MLLIAKRSFLCYLFHRAMKHKRLISTILILILCSSMLWASFLVRPSISFDAGSVFCCPTADYLKTYPGSTTIKNPPVRTSAYVCADFDLIRLGYKDSKNNWAVDISAGPSLIAVSQSLSYGQSVLKGYCGVGLKLASSFDFSKSFNLSLSYSFYDCSYSAQLSHFLVQKVEIRPSYRLKTSLVSIALDAPVSVLFKSDSISILLGLGCTVDLDAIEADRRMKAKEAGK